MRVVFAHDHIFKKDSAGNFYTAGSFNNEVWKRYLIHFDEIIVTARLDKKEIDNNNKYNDFNLPKTSFIPIPSLSGPLAQFKNRTYAAEKIKETLENSDALIARLPSEIGNLAIEIAEEMGKPYAVEVVACVWDALWNYGSIQAKIYAPLATYKMKRLVKKAPYAIYVTNSFLQNRYPCSGKIQNISNVEIQQTLDSSLLNRLNKIENSKQLCNIGMIGNLNNRIKGWDVALRALAILDKNNVDFKFHILGDGDIEQWVNLANELDISHKINFHGVLPGGEPVLKWLDNIDLYMQPSFQEGLPRAVIEAMSRACPVVGSTAGGIPELVDKRCLHKPGDYKGLSQILTDIMLDLDSAKDLAKQNYEESKKYKKEILDDRRSQFFSFFVKRFNNK
ncbi:glycosyltransferase [Peribacillus butanolivorans]|uniref:Glycosyltransferase n=1 Tax=Peribacillus butanolivorans TaxID=421767 RepID=A0ABM6XHZ3_9BACI|nr:glycosyltransferase [Peribacillus butanolivorans]AXN37655.1 glycosyltransferase [Peribacillus butanolivorans]